MDIDVHIGLARTFDEAGDKWERKEQAFFDRVYEGYESLFSFSPLVDRMRRVDANGTPEHVHTSLLAMLDI